MVSRLGFYTLEDEDPPSPEGVALDAAFFFHSVFQESPVGICSSRCPYEGSRFCSVATVEEMLEAARRLVRHQIPIPPCLRWAEEQ
jgi:hypothetical protein